MVLIINPLELIVFKSSGRRTDACVCVRVRVRGRRLREWIDKVSIHMRSAPRRELHGLFRRPQQRNTARTQNVCALRTATAQGFEQGHGAEARMTETNALRRGARRRGGEAPPLPLCFFLFTGWGGGGAYAVCSVQWCARL